MIDYYEGEEKYVTAKVVPKKRYETTVVNSAVYTLTDGKGKVVDSDNCEIDGTELTMLLCPPEKGAYLLKLTVKVGAETIIEKARVYVR